MGGIIRRLERPAHLCTLIDRPRVDPRPHTASSNISRVVATHLLLSNDEVATRFEQLDADHNGVLSPDEVSAVLQDTLGLDAANASHMIEMFDTNRDGNLDKTEFMALWSSMFGP